MYDKYNIYCKGCPELEDVIDKLREFGIDSCYHGNGTLYDGYYLSKSTNTIDYGHANNRIKVDPITFLKVLKGESVHEITCEQKPLKLSDLSNLKVIL